MLIDGESLKMDGIPEEILRKSGENVVGRLENTLERVYNEKRSSDNTEAFRGISLLSTPGNIWRNLIWLDKGHRRKKV